MKEIRTRCRSSDGVKMWIEEDVPVASLSHGCCRQQSLCPVWCSFPGRVDGRRAGNQGRAVPLKTPRMQCILCVPRTVAGSVRAALNKRL